MKRLRSLLFLNPCVVLLAASQSAAQSLTPDADFQKLDAVMGFLRNRNAQDYAITAPNGIDD